MASPLGLKAEGVVAKRLQAKGYKIRSRNWSTRRCEIDIVAEKDKVVYLVEVKYRSGQAQGSGFEYIGPQKLRQMNFAAAIWAKETNWEGDIQLMAADVSGVDLGSIRLIEIV